MKLHNLHYSVKKIELVAIDYVPVEVFNVNYLVINSMNGDPVNIIIGVDQKDNLLVMEHVSSDAKQVLRIAD